MDFDFEPNKLYIYKNSRGSRALLRFVEELETPIEKKSVYIFKMLFPYIDMSSLRLIEEDIERMTGAGGKFEPLKDRKEWAKIILKG